MDSNLNIDLIMLSNFGSSDGGRETWAYNFIPGYLELNNKAKINTYGLSHGIEITHKNRGDLFSTLNLESRDRLKMKFFPIRWTRIPLFFSMCYEIRKFKKADSEPKTDIVVAVGGLFEMLMIIYSGKYKNSKKVLWFRSIFFDEKSNKIPKFLMKLARKIEVYIVKKANILIANGDDIAAYYRNFGFNVSVIKNSVDTTKWNKGDTQLSLPLNIAYIGRLTKVKGIDEFLQAVQIIKKSEHSNKFNFHTIGDGDYLEKSKKLEAEGLLTCYGNIENKKLPELMQKFDACVALTFSSSEGGGGGTSNAMMEQMAAGKVMVAWDNKIFRQLLDNKNSFLVEQGSSQGIADALIAISTDLSSAKQKSIQSQELISKYSIETQLSKFQNLVK